MRTSRHRCPDREAGLPVLTHRGATGGVEPGFNYRSRLTGLAEDEAEALTLWLTILPPELAAPGLGTAVKQARAKFLESLPDRSRAVAQAALARFLLGSELAAAPLADRGDINISRAPVDNFHPPA